MKATIQGIVAVMMTAIILSGCIFRREYREPMHREQERVEIDPYVDDVVEPEVKRVVDPDGQAMEDTSTVRWPSDEDIVFFVAHRSDLDVHMQWRQICEDFDSDWYDMKSREFVGLDADYMMRRSSSFGNVRDTIIVMSSVMRSFPKSGCEWSFRVRLLSKRSISDWITLGSKVILVDPGEFEKIEQPRIELMQLKRKQ